MLFKMHHLRAIKEGTVSLAFRKWKSPRVKKGSVILTAIGQVKVLEVEKIEPSDITSQDATRAGESLNELVASLEKRSGFVYRVSVMYHGKDPRIALRENDQLSESDFLEIRKKMDRWDASSPVGAWTATVLQVIHDHPGKRAQDLADQLGLEKQWLKTQIRKLKGLGLTISHEVGYSLSPRGKCYYKQQRNN